jgi:predicted nucleic acid-binding protein
VRSGHETFLALVTGVEVASAVARQAHAGRLSVQDASAIIEAFQNHFSSQYRVVLTVPAMAQQARDLAQRHGLRGYYAIQLASAGHFFPDALLSDVCFWGLHCWRCCLF